MILMLSGILLGLIILITLPGGAKKADVTRCICTARPGVSILQNKRTLSKLLHAWKAQQRIQTMMKKDRLNAKDSLEIKAIDQQINQLLYD